eukprot:5636834-Pyramimonas_sp.AAC.1
MHAALPLSRSLGRAASLPCCVGILISMRVNRGRTRTMLSSLPRVDQPADRAVRDGHGRQLSCPVSGQAGGANPGGAERARARPRDAARRPLVTPYGPPMDPLWTPYGPSTDPLRTPFGAPSLAFYRDGVWIMSCGGRLGVMMRI